MKSKNNVSIRVNKPPSENFDYPLNVDSRWKIAKLREIIAKEINLCPLNLRMFKGNIKIRNALLFSFVSINFKLVQFYFILENEI